MAIIIPGKSECAECGDILQKGEDIVGLPALFSSSHSLYKYSDAGFHKTCYESLGDLSQIELVLEKLETLRAQKPAIPEGMVFSDFEKTAPYKLYIGKVNKIIQNV